MQKNCLSEEGVCPQAGSRPEAPLVGGGARDGQLRPELQVPLRPGRRRRDPRVARGAGLLERHLRRRGGGRLGQPVPGQAAGLGDGSLLGDATHGYGGALPRAAAVRRYGGAGGRGRGPAGCQGGADRHP